LDYLYNHYSGALYGVIFRIIRKDEIAEEVLQDVFIRAWDRFEQYDASKGRLFTWLLNVARNQAIDKTRSKEISKENKTRNVDDLVNTVDAGAFTEQPVDTIGLKEVLNLLPEEQKFVVDYLYLKGYSQSALAEKFNIPLGTVKTRLRLAMQQLRNILSVR
jgi:RNA polymerase sigma factor (sigma-70 family)